MLSSSSAYLRASFQRYFCSFRPPPSFKEVTPSCRTNMRQLLLREQCLQREQKLGHSNRQQTSAVSKASTSRSQHEMATATIAITREGISPSEVLGQRINIDGKSRESSLYRGHGGPQPQLLASSNVVKAKSFFFFHDL